jgi:hypothetical protein
VIDDEFAAARHSDAKGPKRRLVQSFFDTFDAHAERMPKNIPYFKHPSEQIPNNSALTLLSRWPITGARDAAQPIQVRT